jgi:hypothetical protein
MRSATQALPRRAALSLRFGERRRVSFHPACKHSQFHARRTRQKPRERRGLFWSFTGYSCAVYVDDLRRRSTHGLGNSCSRLIGAESYMAGRRRL